MLGILANIIIRKAGCLLLKFKNLIFIVITDNWNPTVPQILNNFT